MCKDYLNQVAHRWKLVLVQSNCFQTSTVVRICSWNCPAGLCGSQLVWNLSSQPSKMSGESQSDPMWGYRRQMWCWWRIKHRTDVKLLRFQDEKEEAPNFLDFMSEYSFKEWHFSSFANFEWFPVYVQASVMFTSDFRLSANFSIFFYTDEIWVWVCDIQRNLSPFTNSQSYRHFFVLCASCYLLFTQSWCVDMWEMF